MKEDRNKILIVEDQKINRALLCFMVQKDYEVLEAENGAQALQILEERSEEIVAILLDIVMPVMDGFEFLERIRGTSWDGIPVIAMTGDSDVSTEEKTLELGAWDFVIKPYKERILMTRLKNAIARSRMGYLKKIKHMAEHDAVTGLYNRIHFFKKTEEMLKTYPGEHFVFIRMDIKRFRLINSYWGEEEGNKILCFLADLLRKTAEYYLQCTFGRIETDIFGLCIPYEQAACSAMLRYLIEHIRSYNTSFVLEPSFGIYRIDDNSVPAEKMFIFSTMASQQIKHKYQSYIGVYDDSMGRKILQEQEVFNAMRQALKNEEFVVYFQPKYDGFTQLPHGAEALIRWNHPEKGLITPDHFVPVMEKNGFIEQVDYYVWEKVCQYIRKWMDEGAGMAPVSVNMSRVDCSNARLPDNLSKLIKKYDIPPGMLMLELTETAYMDNPEFVNNMIQELRKRGFLIMMDDFGSGFSSLNTLKDIQVDYLKLDMKFLFSRSDDMKSKQILSSVVSMAKWLRLKVVAEGVETEEQFDYLKRIQCDYMQGYYFARPMSAEDYEKDILPLIEKNVSLMNDEDFRQNTLYMTEDIYEKVYLDDLTGVYNRRYLNEWMFLSKMRPGQELKSVAMVLMDIRNFKEINDTYGHLAGDKVLVNVSSVLKKSVRDSDSVIRYGGDEFLIIFLNCPKQRAFSRMQEIHEMFEHISGGEENTHPIAVDFGIAYTENFERTKSFVDQMISHADVIMYKNKKNQKKQDTPEGALQGRASNVPEGFTGC